MKHAFLPFDPIHAAIARHRAAFDASQAAPEEGGEAIEACDQSDASGAALVGTACATRFGALALLAHLRWWLTEEAEFAAEHQPTYGHAEARAADLTLFLGDALAPSVIPTALPPARLPPPRRTVDLRRASRPLMLAGEALAALAIVAGGIVLTGLATML